MTETTCTLTGNLTADPELRFTPSGAAVANFTVAATSRILDKTTNQWRDGQALFMRCTLWRQPAENLAESLHRGDRVILTGRLRQRSFQTREATNAPRSSSMSTRSVRHLSSPHSRLPNRPRHHPSSPRRVGPRRRTTILIGSIGATGSHRGSRPRRSLPSQTASHP